MNDIKAILGSRNGLYAVIGLGVVCVVYLGLREIKHWHGKSQTEETLLWPQIEELEDDLIRGEDDEVSDFEPRQKSPTRPFGHSIMQQRNRLNMQRDEVSNSSKRFEEQPPLIKFRREGVRLRKADSKHGEQSLDLPYGTRILCYSIEPLFSDSIDTLFDGRVAKPLELDGRIIIPVDTRVIARVQRIGKGRVYFENTFDLIFTDGSRRRLKAELQEYAYKKEQDRYMMTHGRTGLPAKEVDPEIYPVIGKIAREVGKTARSVITRAAEYEVREQLPYASVREPIRVIGEVAPKEDTRVQGTTHFFISTGAEFYLSAL